MILSELFSEIIILERRIVIPCVKLTEFFPLFWVMVNLISNLTTILQKKKEIQSLMKNILTFSRTDLLINSKENYLLGSS